MNRWCLLIVGGNILGVGAIGAQTPDGTSKLSTSRLVAPASVGDVHVTVELNNVSVQEALQQIAEKTGMAVTWTDKVIFPEKKITVSLRNAPIEQALRTVLQNTGAEAKLSSNERMIVVTLASASAQTRQQATGMIRGRVTDSATKQGVAGATVTIPGTKHSVLTSANGEFLLRDVPVGDRSVTIKLFGYRAITRTVTVEAGKPVSLQVTLASVPTTLAGVVTSVTGTQKKLEVGNDITTINVDSVLRVAPVSNMTDLLETRVPGLTVMRTSGVPGAPSRIRLRGFGGGLLAGQDGAPTNDPIVIVDGIRINASQSGVSDQNLAAIRDNRQSGAPLTYSTEFPPPSAIDQIDPNSIDKIEVLKGPSASALYGSDAANGVIIITTKRGSVGPTRYSMAVSRGIEYLPGVYAAPGYYPFCHDIATTAGIFPVPGRICTVSNLSKSVLDSIVRFQALNEPRLTSFGRGHRSEISGTVTGGAQALTYSVTGSIYSQLGLLKVPALYQDMFRSLYDSAMPASMRRPSSLQGKSANASITVEPRPGVYATFTSRLTSSAQRQSSAQLQLPMLASQYLDTTSIPPSAVANYVTQVTSNRFVFDNTATANWGVWRALPMTASIGFSREIRDNGRFVANGIIGALGGRSEGIYSTGTGATNTGTARINGTLLPGRRVSVAFGTDLTERSSRQMFALADSLSRGVRTPTRFDAASQSSNTSKTGGWFVEPRLNFNSRYFVNPGFRLDGNNASGRRSGVGGGLWSLFPRLNFSWVALDAEGGTPYLGMISLLRPRLAVGIAGSQPAPQWQLRLMKGSSFESSSPEIEDGGLILESLGNTQLRPERTREVEGGFDIDLWDGRLIMAVTQFYKMRIDAIEQLTVAPSVYGGSLDQYGNIGRIRNSGTEVSVTSIIVETPTVRWGVTASLSKYTNKLVSLNSEEAYIDLGNGTRFVPGYPINGRWIRPILGYAPPSLGERLAKTDIIVGDSVVYVGQQAANFELPVSTSLSLFHGTMSVNATFQYKDGLTQFNSGSAQLVNNLYLNPRATLAEQAAALAASACSKGGDPQCTYYGLIQTVNSLRFNSLSVGFTVPRSLSSRFRVPSMSVAVQGSNLGLWTSYRGKDPDVNGVTVGDATQDSGQLPQPRTWRLQIRVNN